MENLFTSAVCTYVVQVLLFCSARLSATFIKMWRVNVVAVCTRGLKCIIDEINRL